MFLDASIDLLARALKKWLVEEAVPNFARQVAQCGEVSIGDRDHAVEQGSEELVRARGRHFAALQSSFENPQDRRNLLLHSLMGLADPKQTLFELGSVVEVADAVV